MNKKVLLWGLLIAILLGVIYFFNGQNKKEERFLASDRPLVYIYDENLNKVLEVERGKKVRVSLKQTKKKGQTTYVLITYEGKDYYVSSNHIVEELKKAVQETKVYVRTPATLYSNIKEGKIGGLAKKKEVLKITGFDELQEDGTVKIYHTDQGSIYGKYIVLDENEAGKENEEYAKYHKERIDTLGGGSAANLDYYPYKKVTFEDNVMPEKVYALYLNGRKSTIDRVESYIAFAKTTKINAFVVDIKDNCNPAYKSEVMKQLSKTNYDHAMNEFEDYKAAIEKIKDAGFYVIGRITTFKDEFYALDHKEHAISDTRTKKPFLYSQTYWPSPFQRDVWYFNVALAKEAVQEMGFHEIQFDYVRFPDRSTSLEKQGLMDFKNEFEEEKAQAIQRFVAYAVDELHQVGAYVSIDVFGESAYTYVTAYGQYFPAISNIADVISGMPYPDHFSRNTFGIAEPWKEPYQLLSQWSHYVNERQKEIPTPARVRTWVAAYDSIVDGTIYNHEMLEQQIKALFDNDLKGGYMTWNSGSSLEKYQKQKAAYSKEY